MLILRREENRRTRRKPLEARERPTTTTLLTARALSLRINTGPQNRDQPEVQLYVGTFEVYVLAHVALRILSEPSIRQYP